MPSSRCPEDDTDPCKVLSTLVEFIPPGKLSLEVPLFAAYAVLHTDCNGLDECAIQSLKQ